MSDTATIASGVPGGVLRRLWIIAASETPVAALRGQESTQYNYEYQ
jgi:hypothetical protein